MKRLVIVLFAVLAFGACTTTTGGTPEPAPSGVVPAPEPEAIVAVGDIVLIDGVSISAAPMITRRVERVNQLCTDVSFNNRTDSGIDYSSEEWYLNGPHGTSYPNLEIGTGLLARGFLAPHATVAGFICFEDPEQSGEYEIVFDSFVLGHSPVTWYEVR